MTSDVKLFSDNILKDLINNLDVSVLAKSNQTVIIFQTSDIQNILDFFLNCKVLVYNFSKNEVEYEVHDIIKGLYSFLLKTRSNIHYILQLLKEKLKLIFEVTSKKSSFLLISVKENDIHTSIIDEFVTVKSLDIFYTYNIKRMIGYLIEYLEVEYTKCITNLCQENRHFFKQLAYLLPDGVVEYDNQVGGHGLIFGEEMKIQQFKNIVFKPVQEFPKGRTEILFYEAIYGWNQNEDLRNFQIFVPNYYGLFSNTFSSNYDLCIGLEDVISNFVHPSIADIKLGQITYEPDALVGKVAVEKAKYFWREEVGFLFTGIRVFKGINEDDLFLDRFHGLSLDPEMVYFDGILNFLSGNSDRYYLSQLFVEKLTSLLSWFENQKSYHFYSSSLLIAYDQMIPPSETCNISVKMIDFTHCRASTDHDMNSIFGLKSLISYFDRVKLNE